MMIEQLTSVVAGTPEEEENEIYSKIIANTLESVALLLVEDTQLSLDATIEVLAMK